MFLSRRFVNLLDGRLPERQEPGQCSVQTSFSLFYTVWAVHFTSEIMSEALFLFCSGRCCSPE